MNLEYPYFLMHKDTVCAIVLIDSSGTGNIIESKILDAKLAPMGSLSIWWKARAIPSTREDMKSIIRQAGASNPEVYLAKNLALSMTDAYWICPHDETNTLKWNDINLMNFKRTNKPFIPYHNNNSYDINASLGGQMEKYWDLSGSVPVLIKKCFKSKGQQGINELFASLIHSRQPNAPEYVNYTASNNPNPDEDGLIVKCETFIKEGLEFVPAHQIQLAHQDKWMSEYISNYERVIKGWTEMGLDEETVRNFLDYQTMTDFIISNTDRHYSNYGVLRDIDTLELVKPAPIFDSGNSMLYDQLTRTISKSDLLKFKTTSIYDSEEQMIKHVTNRKIVDLDSLPSKEETKNLYMSYGIREERAEFISDAYQKKTEMVHTFQKGMSISLYHNRNFNDNYSKHTEKTMQNIEPDIDEDEDIDI